MISGLSHLGGEHRGVVDDAGDVDGAADRDVEPGGAQDGCGGLVDGEPDVLVDDGVGGDLALVQPAVRPLRGPDGQAPVGGVRGVGGLVPQVRGVGVAAHRQEVETILPQPGDRPVAQPVDPAVEPGGEARNCRHLNSVLLSEEVLETGQTHVVGVVGVDVGETVGRAGVRHQHQHGSRVGRTCT